jgi:uncharacterized membrane protein
MARLFSIKPGITLKGRKFKGIRGFAGKPFHPPLTDIPIGAYVIAAAFDIISFVKGDSDLGFDLFRAATYVVIAGAIVSVFTALTGFWDWLKSTEKHTQAWRTANWHMAVMLTVTAIVIVDIIVRLGDFNEALSTSGLVMVLSAIVGGLVAYGAAYGGELVFEYEFNVEQNYGGVWAESETDIYPSDVSDS